MYKQLERYVVQKLRKKKVSQKEVRDLTGISEKSIQRIENEPEITEINEARFRKSRNMGRPSLLTEHEEQVLQWFSEPRAFEDGPIKSQEILARLRQAGYTGGKTAVYELVKRIRPKESAKPLLRFEGLPGEFSQHDFGQRWVSFTDGRRKLVRFFASRLKYSRFIDIQIVENEQQETVVRSLLKAFEHFGGVPMIGVFDNMSSAVKSREIQEDGSVKVHWTDRFGQFVVDCGLIPLACWPYRPQEKGSVENLVGFVKGNFFCGREFIDMEDIHQQLQAWMSQVNEQRPCDATGEIPAVLLKREPLQPLHHQAQTYAFKVSVVVRPTARVHYRGIEYSVPGHAIGQAVTLHLQQEHVSIYQGERCLGVHLRFPENGKSSVLSEHAQELFDSPYKKPYAQRQILLDLDPLVEPYLTELVHRRPQAWFEDVDLTYQLYEKVGRTELLAAIELAVEARCIGSEYLLEFIEHPHACAQSHVLLNSSEGGTVK
ncbi:MAG: IS21 family transposase [Acaryochloris sp. RU_4_1]|nr:IS21 family transposase [Acaryochloris sp. RU_4_1]NJR55394.1 IS21 family transposase [Acaryochloris sp. CRU_2_0]